MTQRDLVRNALRMRPDRIIVGEVRGAEAFDMMQAMNTGHEGSVTTVHANSPRDALSRIENMVMMAGFDLPTQAIRQQMASALHLVVQISRMGNPTFRTLVVDAAAKARWDAAKPEHDAQFQEALKNPVFAQLLSNVVGLPVPPAPRLELIQIIFKYPGQKFVGVATRQKDHSLNHECYILVNDIPKKGDPLLQGNVVEVLTDAELLKERSAFALNNIEAVAILAKQV